MTLISRPFLAEIYTVAVVYGEGIFRTWPTRIRVEFMLGFAACSALNFTPNLRAMPTTVSPETTVCVRGLMAIAALPERFVFALAGCAFWTCWTAAGRADVLFGEGDELVAAANWLA